MLIARVSPLTGKTNTLDLAITQEQYNNWKIKRQLIQKALPDLTSDQREFLISGCFPGEFGMLCQGEDNDE